MVGKRLVLLLALFLVQGCSKQTFTTFFDSLSFRWTGHTFFQEAGVRTFKEIHFDSGNLLGQDVIIEGRVLRTGEFFTHVVLTDNSGRMLVVLTDISDAEALIGTGREGLMVLGTVERGRKGLPFVLARSLKPVESSKM